MSYLPYYECDKCGAEMKDYWVYIQYRGSEAHLCKNCAGALTRWMKDKERKEEEE